MRRIAYVASSLRYIGYLDAIDGSAQAWSLPGAWGHVMLVQEFVGLAADGGPDCQMRFLGVLDAEGGTTFAESALPYVSVDIIDRSEGDAYSDDLELSYSEEGEKFEVTSTPVVLAGGYKPTWWQAFSTLRERVAARWPDVKVPVFNTAGAPVTRKVIQNADNVAVQLAASSLWDGATAALVSRAGGYVFEIGETEPKAHDVVWSWWSQFGYERDPRPEVVGRWRPATHIPAFVAGMDLARTRAVAEECIDLPSCTWGCLPTVARCGAGCSSLYRTRGGSLRDPGATPLDPLGMSRRLRSRRGHAAVIARVDRSCSSHPGVRHPGKDPAPTRGWRGASGTVGPGADAPAPRGFLASLTCAAHPSVATTTTARRPASSDAPGSARSPSRRASWWR